MANGDIGAVIDTLEFYTADITKPDMVHVAGDVYVIAYENATGDGEMATVEIDAAGQIGAAVIDTLIFDAVDGHEVSIIHVSGTIFAVAYRGVGADGFLITVDITAAGQIGAAVIDSLEFDTTACYEPDMILITDDVVAIVSRGDINQGNIVTVEIDAAGQIGAAVIASLSGYATNINNPKIILVAGGVYVIASSDNAYDGWIHTVGINAAGGIGAAVIDSLEFDATNGGNPSILKTYDGIFAIAYKGDLDDGYLVTIDIGVTGNIGAAVIDSLEFDTTACYEPDMLYIGEGVVAIAYAGDLEDGYLVTAQIDAAGQIGAAVIDSLEFDTTHGVHPSLIHVSGDIYAVAYRGIDVDGFLVTVDVETPSDGRLDVLQMMGVG